MCIWNIINIRKERAMPKKNIKEEKKLNPCDFILCITVALLLSLGIVMVLSASSPSSLSETESSYTYVIKQLQSAILGIVLMIFISRIDYRILKNKKIYLAAYIVSVGILFLVLVPGIGKSVNGARRWIKLGITFQPSEITKVGLIVFFAAILTENRDKLKNIKTGFFAPLAFVMIPALILLLVQNHLSVVIVLVVVVSVMMLMAGSKLSHFATFGSIGAVLGSIGLYIMAKYTESGSFRIKRITSFLNPWADAKGAGWQVIQSLYAIGSGGLFGVGLGDSKQKYLYIPEPHNDFIFAVLAEELGFFGCVIVILLFAIFIWRGILIAMKAPDMFGSLLAIGITTLIGIQAIINIAVVTSSIPNTGMPLPFFSYGGTSLVILLCSVGILLNISRQSKKV